MKKLLCVLITAVVFLVLIGGYVYSSSSPYVAIRKHLLMIDPVQALTCDIQPTALIDFERGHTFIIVDFSENKGLPGESRVVYRIYNVYVKVNKIGLYYVTTIVGGFDTEPK